CQQHDDCPLTF
nr:immunoglobulin light chain junction region [Macaca mulatta]